MEKSIVIKYEHREDGRMYINIYSGHGKHIEYEEWLSVMVGALSMTIRMVGEKGYKTEGEVFQNVMEHLTSEFVNPDSFKDLEIKR